jgi:SnoaL-like domain
MSGWRFLVALILIATAGGVRWGYGQQSKAGPTLTAMDYIEIQQLYARYAFYLDTGADREAYANLWTADGEFVAGRPAGQATADRAPLKGREALTRMGSSGGWRHFNSNIIITPTAEGADGMSYLVRFNLRQGVVPAPYDQTSIYKDTLIKTPQGWRFKKRVSWRDDDDLTPFRAPSQAAPQ